VLGFGDPIADAVGLLRPSTVIHPSLRAAGAWALRFEAVPHVKIGGLVTGGCWLVLDGREPVRLEQGDTFLLGAPPAHTLASSPGVRTRRGEPLLESGAEEGVVSIGPVTDDSTYLCSGHLVLDDRNAAVLTDFLPPLVVVRSADPRGRPLAQLIELLSTEVEEHAPGGALAMNHLAQLLLVQMLRAHAHQAGHPVGWMRALRDDGIGTALRAMHADVAHPWTLAELAAISLMSRSAFAHAFRSQVGVPPLEYLIRWRMGLARDAIAQDTMSISDLARATGYGSESAFSSAFRREVGVSPSAYRSELRQHSAAH
jgi:AraC-like DNA-binding protein